MCDARLIDVTGAPTDKLMAANPFYRVAIIPGAVKACEEPGLK